MAASQSGDEAALQQVQRGDGGRNIERRVDDLLRKMTLDEKLQQLTLLSDGQMKEDPTQAAKGVGGVFSETDPVLIDKYQHDAVEKSRLHIPILFAFDTIHGFRTIFPIPLGAASSFDPERRVHRSPHRRVRVGRGRHQADLQPDGRRLARAALGPHLRGRGRGPVPELGDGRRARHRRPGQGLLRARTRRVTSVKHFVAYGQPESGRDYNTTDMSEQRLRNFYLPPFKAAIDAGADTVMCSFNAINGVPGLRERVHGDRHPQERVGLRRLHRERLHGGRRAARVPGRQAGRRSLRPRRRGRRPGRRRPGAQRRHGLRDGLDQLPRLRQGAGREPARVDQAHRRRRAPDPADQVPRRAVRASLRRRRRRARQAAAAGEPRRGPRRRRQVDRPAQERRQRAAAQDRPEDRADRPARRQPARHARPVVGPRRRQRRDLALHRHEGAEPEHDVHAGLHA